MKRETRQNLALVGARTCAIFAVAFAAAATGAGFKFSGSDRVEFESVSYAYPPSAFKIKQAQKLGKQVEIITEPRVPIFGYLANPGKNAPQPAVVLLHTCAGVSNHDVDWSERLASWGYVVLTVDSFSPRGYRYVCDGREGEKATPWLRALDAFGAKQYLSTLPFVDPDRIAVMGLSHGGMTVLEAIKQSTVEGLKTVPFQAAVAFYPLCSVPEPISTPTLILVGSEDSWTPATFCSDYVDKLSSEHDIGLEVFPGAHHLFDHPDIDMIDAGHIIRSHPEAAARARQILRTYLERYL